MSTLKTTNIKHGSSSSNNIVLSSDGSVSIPSRTFPSGETIETIAGICDGRTISVGTGNYTLGNVTASQGLTTTYEEITGSSIAYTPPSGTKQLMYKFVCQFSPATNSGISHFKIQVNGTDIDKSRITKAGDYHSYSHHHSQLHMVWIFDLTETSDDVANGKIAGSGWTSNKTIRTVGREYDGSTYHGAVHANDLWDGAASSGANAIVVPHLYIQAIA